MLVPAAALIVGVTPSVPLGPVWPCGPRSPVAPFKLLNVKVVVVPEVLAVTEGVPTAPILEPAAALIVGVTPSVPLGPVWP